MFSRGERHGRALDPMCNPLANCLAKWRRDAILSQIDVRKGRRELIALDGADGLAIDHLVSNNTGQDTGHFWVTSIQLHDDFRAFGHWAGRVERLELLDHLLVVHPRLQRFHNCRRVPRESSLAMSRLDNSSPLEAATHFSAERSRAITMRMLFDVITLFSWARIVSGRAPLSALASLAST
eukprot:scaffold576_cov260-Pinguiococcus_pyrenoidosus.AAC.90